MYKLTLTLEERLAIEWVGYRDWNGDDLRKKLYDQDVEWYVVGRLCKELCSKQSLDELWNPIPMDLTFHIPEHIAWEIMALYIEDGNETIPHFAPELKAKIQTLLDSIVWENGNVGNDRRTN